MPSITIFTGACRYEEGVSFRVAEFLGFKLIDDQALISEASKRFQLPVNKFQNALAGKTSVFNKFTHEKERSIAYLKLLLADHLKKGNLVFCGFAGQLIPKNITNVLRVGIVPERKDRVRQAMKIQGVSEKDSLRFVRKENEKATLWTNSLFQKDPWDAELYDIIIPMNKESIEDAVSLICEHVQKDIIKPTAASRKAVEDFCLAAEVEAALAKEGHDVSVLAKDGVITLTINKHVLMLSRLEEDLKRIAKTISGVKDVKTEVGPGFYKSDIYRKFDLEKPSKVMVVDDEREFVRTLSDRLLIRDMGAATVYDGKEALSLIEEDEPEVMVLDLKMPGIDGFEILRRVKKEHPRMEVIVLTGQGSKDDKETCLQLGAFAYFEKPLNMGVLTQTMQDAYKKVREQDHNVADRQD